MFGVVREDAAGPILASRKWEPALLQLTDKMIVSCGAEEVAEKSDSAVVNFAPYPDLREKRIH